MGVLTTTWQAGNSSRRLYASSWLFPVVDLVVITCCFALGRATNWIMKGMTFEEAVFGWHEIYGNTRWMIFLGLAIACVIAFAQFGHYARRRPFWQEVGDVAGVAVTMAILDAALVFLTKTNFSRMWWGASWCLVALLVPITRLVLKRALLARSVWVRPAVVVGAGSNAVAAASAFESEPLLGFKVMAFVRPAEGSAEASDSLRVGSRTVPVLSAPSGAQLLPPAFARAHVVVALELDEIAACSTYVERLSLYHGDVDMVSSMRGLPVVGAQITHFFSQDVLALRLQNNLARPWARHVKRAFDLLVGGTLLVLSAPLLALIGWAVSRDGGPICYQHERIGRGNKPFKCLKFRTMVPDAKHVLADHLAHHFAASAEWHRDHKLRHDPRITQIGAWLRRTSLDELPQLINVIRGEMSLVGPRPVVRDELERYGDDLMYYLESVPGLTGLWQVSGRNNLDYERRVHLDCWYARNWSLWWDLVILFKTPQAVIRGDGAY